MIKAILFDIDNTLYDYDSAHKVAFAALCGYAQRHLGLSEEEFTRRHKETMTVVKEHLGAECAATHNRLLRYQVLLERGGKPLFPHALKMEEIYWETLLRAAVPSPHAVECLRELKEKGYTVGIGTDMTVDWQLKKLTRMGMLEYIDFVVSSEEVLTEKPSEKLFLRCAEKAGASPAECLFIGDNRKKDVCGALDAGMKAIWFRPFGPDPEHPELTTISDFEQLEELLEGFNGMEKDPKKRSI